MSLSLWNNCDSQSSGVVKSNIGPDGTIRGSMGFSEGKFGGAIERNSSGGVWTGNSLEFPTSSSWFNPVSGRMSFWLKITDYPVPFDHRGYIFACGRVDVNLEMPLLYAWFGDDIIFYILGDTGSSQWPGYTITGMSGYISLNTWVNLGVVWDRNGIAGSGDYVRHYLNGSMIGNITTAPTSAWGTTNTNNYSVCMGGGVDDGFVTPRFAMDEIKVYTDANIDFNDIMSPRYGYQLGGLNA